MLQLLCKEEMFCWEMKYCDHVVLMELHLNGKYLGGKKENVQLLLGRNSVVAGGIFQFLQFKSCVLWGFCRIWMWFWGFAPVWWVSVRQIVFEANKISYSKWFRILKAFYWSFRAKKEAVVWLARAPETSRWGDNESLGLLLTLFFFFF